MAWYPAAIRKPLTTKTWRSITGPRRLILHTAVSSASSLWSYYNSNSVPYSHFYLRADGTLEQYVDTRHEAPANLEANDDSISVESQDRGGPFPSWSGSNVPPWTPAQLDALARLAAWLHEVHDIPLAALPDSDSGRRGVGWHRLGIDGNFPDGLLGGRLQRGGGETWSTSRGKVCPGDNRIRQIAEIIAQAKGDDMSTAKDVAEAVWSYTSYGSSQDLKLRRAERADDVRNLAYTIRAQNTAILAAVEGLDHDAVIARIDHYAAVEAAWREKVFDLLEDFHSGMLDANAVVARIGELLSQAAAEDAT